MTQCEEKRKKYEKVLTWNEVRGKVFTSDRYCSDFDVKN